MILSYISGGTVGFMGTDAYNGNDLIKESGNDVVVVVIQYRLGLFGFLAGEATKREGALNFGLCKSSVTRVSLAR